MGPALEQNDIIAQGGEYSREDGTGKAAADDRNFAGFH
jgi:hypothetical protein